METDTFEWPESLDDLPLILESRTGGQVREIRIELSSDRCVLLGRAHTYHARQLAYHIALDVLGQHVELVNEIVVC